MANDVLIEMLASLSLDSGVVTSSAEPGTIALSDSTKNWTVDKLKHCMVRIVYGKGAGQLVRIIGNSADSLLVSPSWVVGLDTTSAYVIYQSEVSDQVDRILTDVNALSARFTAGRAGLLDRLAEITAARMAELDAANIPTDLANIQTQTDKIGDATIGLAALKAALDSLAGGAFYGSYGPKNVEVDNDVDFGIILYGPSGTIITVGEITPGTYTVHRVRGAVNTEIVAATPSLEAAGRVYMTYNFPVADWEVGDIFYITFLGIQVTIDGITTEYPDLYIWGRVVREAGIEAKVDAIEAKLDALAGVGVLQEQADVPFNVNASNAGETNIFDLSVANTRYIVRSLRLKCVDPGAETVTVRLYELVFNVLTLVDSFDITNANFATYHSLMDMFGIPYLAGDNLKVTVIATAVGPYAVTGQYTLAIATV